MARGVSRVAGKDHTQPTILKLLTFYHLNLHQPAKESVFAPHATRRTPRATRYSKFETANQIMDIVKTLCNEEFFDTIED